MASAFVVIVIVVLSQTNPPLLDDTETVSCIMMYPKFVFVSEQHCWDEVNKCQSQIPGMIVTMEYEDKTPQCLDMNGILRK